MLDAHAPVGAAVYGSEGGAGSLWLIAALHTRVQPRRRASSIMPADLEAKGEALPRLREALQVEEAASPMAHVRNVMRLFFDVWTGRLDVASLTLFHDIDGAQRHANASV